MPATGRANHGAATTSTKVSASSLRQTKRAPQRVGARAHPADEQPLGGHGQGGRDQAAERQHRSGGDEGDEQVGPVEGVRQRERDRRHEPDSPGSSGTSRQSSTAARATFSRVGGA